MECIESSQIILARILILTFLSVISVGFEQEAYTCVEGEHETCEVCISILSSTQLDSGLVASLSVTTVISEGEFDVQYTFLSEIISLFSPQPLY